MFVDAAAVFVGGTATGRTGAFVGGLDAGAVAFVTIGALVFVAVAIAFVDATMPAGRAGALVAGLGAAAG